MNTRQILRICGRELRAMQARPVPTQDLYGQRILVGGDAAGRLYARVQDHLRDHHGLVAIPMEIESEAINEAIAAVSTGRSWEIICGDANHNNCWPRRALTAGRVAVYRLDEIERAQARAGEVAERNPDDEQ